MNNDENAIGLTTREWQCARMMASGMRMKEVADVLGISQYTVQAHVRNIFEKTQCRNMSSVIYKALTANVGMAIEEHCHANDMEMIQWMPVEKANLLGHLERVLLQYEATITEATHAGGGNFFAAGQIMPRPIRIARYPKGLPLYRKAGAGEERKAGG